MSLSSFFLLEIASCKSWWNPCKYLVMSMGAVVELLLVEMGCFGSSRDCLIRDEDFSGGWLFANW